MYDIEMISLALAYNPDDSDYYYENAREEKLIEQAMENEKED